MAKLRSFGWTRGVSVVSPDKANVLASINSAAPGWTTHAWASVGSVVLSRAERRRAAAPWHEMREER